jgi:hypothetical protein
MLALAPALDGATFCEELGSASIGLSGGWVVGAVPQSSASVTEAIEMSTPPASGAGEVGGGEVGEVATGGVGVAGGVGVIEEPPQDRVIEASARADRVARIENMGGPSVGVG